ncbi:MAG TPA: UDP-N-acetylmuramoyl-tripeptide--D-alanyl-D-alanine ligase [Candidatus Omnitrophota bacterium]|nr:UDP-N-acetylmuramoyl-tripeptide--D-alanyl-D-alanine ligase [Candidatus Omnitrophota bacterium]
MFTIEEILFCTNGKIVNSYPALRVRGVSTDTRTIRPGDLFVALSGKNFDGHQFIKNAISKKASALLVSKKILLPHARIPTIIVEDTLQAYCALAKYHRARFSIPVIALTGSVGKTTTKELLGKVLSSHFHLLKNFQTENNEIGVAKTLLQLNNKHSLAVLEFGTNHFGEIERLARMGQPTIAILTNIGDSHLEFLKNRQGVFKEKSNIFRCSPRLECIVYNSDDDWLATIGIRYPKTDVLRFSIDKKSHYQAKNITAKGMRITFQVGSEKFSLKTLSKENVYNALVAIALGRKFRVPYAQIKRSLWNFRFPKGRQNILKVSGRWVIDDTYNANPASVSSALNALELFPSSGKKYFVFGDMKELGRSSRTAHQRVGRLSADKGVKVLLAYGTWSRIASEQACKHGVESHHYSRQEKIVEYLMQNTLPADVILIKGSRGMRMEHIVNKLQACHF